MALSNKVFLMGMARLGDAFKDFNCTKSTMKLYREFMDPLTDEAFTQAVETCIRDGKWFPKVSELLEAAVPPIAPASIVWEGLISGAEADQMPEMDTPTRLALEAVGGWGIFQELSYTELNFLFKRFEAVYVTAAESARDGLKLPAAPAQPRLENK